MVYIVERKRKYMYGMGKCACIFECCVWAYMYMPVCFYMYVHYVCTHMYFYVYACGDVYIYMCICLCWWECVYVVSSFYEDINHYWYFLQWLREMLQDWQNDNMIFFKRKFSTMCKFNISLRYMYVSTTIVFSPSGFFIYKTE